MSERNCDVSEIVVCQMRKYGDVNFIVGKTLRVLSETKLPKPRGNLWHVASRFAGRTQQDEQFSSFRAKCGRFRAPIVTGGRVISARLRQLLLADRCSPRLLRRAPARFEQLRKVQGNGGSYSIHRRECRRRSRRAVGWRALGQGVSFFHRRSDRVQRHST